jgi:hypothetical protein
MLVGLAIDVSGSMTQSIHNAKGPSLNRLEAFRESLQKLAERGRSLARKDSAAAAAPLVHLFAYGFGFGNPISVLLGRRGAPARDLLLLEERETSLTSIVDLADHWTRYEAHLKDLAVDMFGSTPMLEALELARDRFDLELRRRHYQETTVLFLLSDGMPNRGTESAVLDLAYEIRKSGHLIVSCFVTDADLTEPRHLHRSPEFSWPDEARLMFECASEIPPGSVFTDYLGEYGWTVDESAHLFAQINRSDVLTEFLNAVISPIRSPSAGVEVFISYAHEDEELREQLEKHLSVLRRQGLITTWHDRKIVPGSEWARQIDEHIDSARLVLLLISENFVSSDYCYGIELARALERHEEGTATVVPVILKPVDWEGAPFGRLAMLPTDAKPVVKWRSRAEAFTDVARGIRRAVEELATRDPR